MKSKIALTCIGLIVLTSIAACDKAETKEKPAKPVKAKAVEVRSSTSTLRYSATIRPATQVEVAFKVSGYIDSIAQAKDPGGQWRYLQAGDTVRKGALLAQLRQSDYAARVNEAMSQHGEARSALDTNSAQLGEATASIESSRAQVTDAQASFDRAKLDFERSEALFGTQSITKPDYDAAKAQFEISQAKLEAAQGQLRVAEAKVRTARAQIGAAESRIKTAKATADSARIPLQDTQLRAPMTAVIIERRVEVGTLVSQGTPGFVLADLTAVKAAFGVPDLSLKNMKLGDTLSLTTDAIPGTEFSGHISRISPSADTTSRVFDVEVTIPNTQGMLKPGMIASLIIQEGAGTSVELPVVPLTAVTRSKDHPEQYAVFVIEERQGKHFARIRNVTLGESFGNAIVVTGGVNKGELVVTTGVTQVADGDQITVIAD